MKKLIALLLSAMLVICSCPVDSGGGGPVDIKVPSDLMGLVHAGSRTLIADSANVKAQFDLLDEIGVQWILDDFSWSRIQRESEKDKSPAEWNWSGEDNYVKNANERGKKILGILDYDTNWLHGGKTGEKVTVKDHLGADVNVDVYADGHLDTCVIGDDETAKFCAYVRAAVTRYNGKNGYGKVDAWRIWNEPNLYPRFWTGTMEQFFELSKAAAAAIREVDPDAVIVAGALNSIANDAWIQGLYSSGAMNQVNFTSFHPYSLIPTGTAGVFQSFVDKSPPAFRDKVWVTEVGHPTAPRNNYYTEVPEEQMPQTIVKTIVLLVSRGAQKIFWYHLSDRYDRNENDSEHWFGLYHDQPDGSLKPKGYLPDAYKLCAENIPGKTYKVSGLPGLKLPDNVQSHYFEGSNGRRCLVVWNNSLINAPAVTINLPGTGHILHNPADASAVPVEAKGDYVLSTRDSADEKILFFTWDAE